MRKKYNTPHRSQLCPLMFIIYIQQLKIATLIFLCNAAVAEYLFHCPSNQFIAGFVANVVIIFLKKAEKNLCMKPSGVNKGSIHVKND